MTVLIDQRGPITVFTIDRPERRNAFDEQLTGALDEALNNFEDDPRARVGVITGGSKVFSAGTDVVAWAGPPTPRGGPYGIAGRRLTKPIIAAVEGLAAGGGFEIVLSTTMVVAAENACFSLPEVGLGLVAECGGLFRGPRALPLNIAREMLLTGNRLSAHRSYELGLINRIVPPGSALRESLVVAESICSRAPIAVRETMHALEMLYSEDDERNWALTDAAKRSVRSSGDAIEGVSAFTERRVPRWSGL